MVFRTVVVTSFCLVRAVSLLVVILLTFQNINTHVRVYQESFPESELVRSTTTTTTTLSHVSSSSSQATDEKTSFLPPVQVITGKRKTLRSGPNNNQSKSQVSDQRLSSVGKTNSQNESKLTSFASDTFIDNAGQDQSHHPTSDLDKDPSRNIQTFDPILHDNDKNSGFERNITSILPAMGNGTIRGNFKKYDNVVIATKIHGPHQWLLVEQSLCLLHHAYNHRVLYDIVVFTTIPIPLDDVQSLQTLVSPANVTVVVDNPGLQNAIAALPNDERDRFLQMCNVSYPENVTWFSLCPDRIAYNWQAEFRGLKLWHHPSMANYSTMLWMDADGFATKPWENDPIEFFIENDGVVMFDHFPQAFSNRAVQPRLFHAFQASICKLKVDNVTGNLVSSLDFHKPCKRKHIPNIHGFFHITNLDFFRTPKVTQALQELFRGYFLSRFPDDQLAVTAVAAIYAPERSWEMRSKGFHLDVFHNHKLDGIDQAMPAGFLKYYPSKAKDALPSADGVCPITAAN